MSAQFQRTVKDTYLEDSTALLQAAIDLTRAANAGMVERVTDGVEHIRTIWRGVAKHSPQLVPPESSDVERTVEDAMVGSEKLYAMAGVMAAK